MYFNAAASQIVKRTLWHLPLIVLLHAASANAEHDRRHYDASQQGWSGLAQLAFTFGGDEVDEVPIEEYYGNDVENEDIKAGELMLLSGGVKYTHQNVDLQLTIGYLGDGVAGDNGDADFTRWPIELLAFVNTGRVRLGAGATAHMNPRYDVDIDELPDETIDFHNAIGFIVQVDYIIWRGLSAGVRFTGIEYEAEGSSDKVDGDSVGVIASFAF